MRHRHQRTSENSRGKLDAVVGQELEVRIPVVDVREELQADLDCYLEFYDRERAHQSYRTQGRTPYQAFLDGVKRISEVKQIAEVDQPIREVRA